MKLTSLDLGSKVEQMTEEVVDRCQKDFEAFSETDGMQLPFRSVHYKISVLKKVCSTCNLKTALYFIRCGSIKWNCCREWAHGAILNAMIY